VWIHPEARYAVAPMRRRLAALMAALLLALPAAATAQNAGDEQYSDPFGGTEQPEGGGGDGGSNGSETPSTPSAPPAEPAVEDTAPADTSEDSGSALPQTGFPAALAAALGLLLLGFGASVRGRTRPPLALPPWVTPGTARRRRRRRRRR
jgi:LPXTG-motif cell wall-anchored protein